MGRFVLGEVLSSAFGLVWRNFGLYLATQGIFVVAGGLLAAIAMAWSASALARVVVGASSQSAAVVGGALLAALFPVFLAVLITSFLGLFGNFFGIVVTDGILRGERRSLSRSWELARPRFGTFFATAVVAAVVPIAIMFAPLLLMLAGALAALGSGSVAGAVGLMTIGLLLFFVAIGIAIWLLLRWYVAPVAAVMESSPVAASLARSSALTVGSKGTIFGLMLVLGILTGVLGAIANMPMTIAEISSSRFGSDVASVPSAESLVGQQIAGTVVALFMSPVFVAAMTLVYYRLIALPAPVFAVVPPGAPVTGGSGEPYPASSPATDLRRCPQCNAGLNPAYGYCVSCGAAVR